MSIPIDVLRHIFGFISLPDAIRLRYSIIIEFIIKNKNNK